MATKTPPDPRSARLDALRANSDRLTAALGVADPGHVASLARELRATVAEIADLEAELSALTEVSLSDELAEKRRRRVSAKADPPAGRRSQSRRSGGSIRTG